MALQSLEAIHILGEHFQTLREGALGQTFGMLASMLKSNTDSLSTVLLFSFSVI